MTTWQYYRRLATFRPWIVAVDLTLATESVTTKTITEWRQGGGAIGKRPAVFLLLAR